MSTAGDYINLRYGQGWAELRAEAKRRKRIRAAVAHALGIPMLVYAVLCFAKGCAGCV